MASSLATEIRAALIAFFQRRLPNRKVNASSNVKRLCGYDKDPAGWRALARSINRLSTVRKARTRLTPAELDGVSTIAGIERRLLLAKARLARSRLRRHIGGGGGIERLDWSWSGGGRACRGCAGCAPSGRFRSRKKRVVARKTSKKAAARELGRKKKAAASGPATERPLQDDAKYLVWYGTNRKPIDPNNVAKGYSGGRDQKIHLGTCEVFVPKSHKIGSTGSSWWERWKSGVDDRLKLLAIRELAAAEYWRTVASHLGSLELSERDAVIFVHGYNVSFEDAALRAAQVGFDLSIKGAMAFFSWPSQGKPGDYTVDEASIEASEPWITQFMADFAARSGAARVHIIAHSMGNRGVLRAVDRMTARAQERTGTPFDQIILAAADVDADTFRNLCAAYARVSRRTTLYVSSRDLAVGASRWLHTFPRAGLLPPIMVVPGIDTINVTNADLTTLGHGYVAEVRDVLQDMHQLLAHGDPPDLRFGLREDKTEAGERFWVIGK